MRMMFPSLPIAAFSRIPLVSQPSSVSRRDSIVDSSVKNDCCSIELSDCAPASSCGNTLVLEQVPIPPWQQSCVEDLVSRRLSAHDGMDIVGEGIGTSRKA